MNSKFTTLKNVLGFIAIASAILTTTLSSVCNPRGANFKVKFRTFNHPHVDCRGIPITSYNWRVTTVVLTDFDFLTGKWGSEFSRTTRLVSNDAMDQSSNISVPSNPNQVFTIVQEYEAENCNKVSNCSSKCGRQIFRVFPVRPIWGAEDKEWDGVGDSNWDYVLPNCC